MIITGAIFWSGHACVCEAVEFELILLALTLSLFLSFDSSEQWWWFVS